MTVASNINKHIYLGNGATTEWPYSFPIIDKSHIKIYLTDTHGNITELINNYYVNTDTNVIIYPGWEPGTEPPEELRPPKLPAGWKLTILRKVPIVQEIDLQNQGPFYAETIEQGLDKLTMIAQQQSEQLSRAVQLPIDSTGGGDSLLTDILATSAAAQAAHAGAEQAKATAEVSAQAAQAAALTAQQYAGSIEVASVATANKLLKLDANAKLPASITGDAATVGGKSPGTSANNVLVLDASGKVPQGNLPSIPSANLPIASASTLGGIKVGANLSVDANGVLSGSASTPHGIQVFTSSGTFTVPANVTQVWVTMCGGGGGGGGGYDDGAGSAYYGGGGGGAHAVFNQLVTGLTAGQQISVTVGAGGNGGAYYTNGSTGGTSSFGAFVSCPGGGGGGRGTGSADGSGGGAGGSGGTVGNKRAFLSASFGNLCPAGGNSILGNGNNVFGAVGTGYGAGGSGGMYNGAGGNGAPGICIVEW